MTFLDSHVEPLLLDAAASIFEGRSGNPAALLEGDADDRAAGEPRPDSAVDEARRRRAADAALRAANEQLQFQIKERHRIESLLATENRILELIATGAERDALLEALCEAVESLVPNSRCAIRLGLAGEQAGAAPVPSNGGVPRCDTFGAIPASDMCPPLGLERTTTARLPAEADRATGRPSVSSCLYEPIVGAAGATVGTLAIYFADAGPPSEDALWAGATAARLAAIAIERARTEELAREQLSQLAHVSRLATMGEMASGLAHELNQPLCAIVNYTEACVELVTRDEPDRAQLSHSLREVARQAERAGEVIRRLRDFVRRGEPIREAVDVNAVMRDVSALTALDARHSDVRVRLKLDRRPPRVFADAIQIEQVLVNLVRNACEAMLQARSPSRAVVMQTRRRKGCVELAVGDSGPGVPAEAVERLFEPFFTTKRNGMGMGLSISRSIIDAHDGRIWVAGNPQGGATFHFTLPTVWRVSREHRRRIRGG